MGFTALFLFALAACTHAQDPAAGEAAAAAPSSEAAAAENATVVCPIKGGGYNEKNAVAQLLISQDRVVEGEACMLDAIAAVLPSFAILSNIAAAKQQPNRASVFSHILETLNPSAENVLLHATRLNGAKQFDQAASRFELLLKNNPENAGIANSLGVTLFNSGHLEAAIKQEPSLEAAKLNLDVVKQKLAEPAQ